MKSPSRLLLGLPYSLSNETLVKGLMAASGTNTTLPASERPPLPEKPVLPHPEALEPGIINRQRPRSSGPGILWVRRKIRPHGTGTKQCTCGRPISTNKTACARCS